MDPALVLVDVTGVAGILGGSVTVGLGVRRRLISTPLLAAATLTWGIATLAVSGSPGAHPDDSGWAVLSALLAAAGALFLLRHTRDLLDGLRLMAETVMVTAAVPLLVHVVLAATGDPTHFLPLTVLPLSLAFGVLVAMATRRPDRAIACSAIGAALVLAGDAVAAVLPGAPGALGHALLNLVGWPLVLAGLLAAGRKAERPRTSEQMRPNTVAASFALALGTVTVGVVAVFGVEVDLVTATMATAFLVAFWVQELIHGMQQKALLSRLAELAGTDPLTGLGNRRALSAALANVQDAGAPAALLTVDLDNFKSINTLLGHQVGDELLAAVAEAMQAECGGSGAQVFRLGGDEFAVLVAQPGLDAAVLGERLIDRIGAATRDIPGAGRVDVSASVGVAHPDLDADAEVPPARSRGLQQLTRSGDAMRAAKAAGRARVVTYDCDIARRQGRHDALERRLRRAIDTGAVELHLQPIISLPELRMVGLEALARWTDEELGPVTPTEFIAVAEDTGLIVELGLQLTRRSMDLLISTGAHDAGLVGGVNVSPTQLRQVGFVDTIADLITEKAINPAQFVLEVTESVRIEADDPAVTAIWALAEFGFPVAIDDFGTGYASLSLINSLPAKILKLDRSIIQRLDEPRGLAIARCVTEMTRSLEIDVVAEGIETEAQLDVVRALGVGFGQGWLFSRAVTPERFTDFVRDPDLALGRFRPAAAAASDGPAAARSTPPAP